MIKGSKHGRSRSVPVAHYSIEKGLVKKKPITYPGASIFEPAPDTFGVRVLRLLSYLDPLLVLSYLLLLSLNILHWFIPKTIQRYAKQFFALYRPYKAFETLQIASVANLPCPGTLLISYQEP